MQGVTSATLDRYTSRLEQCHRPTPIGDFRVVLETVKAVDSLESASESNLLTSGTGSCLALASAKEALL